MYKYLATTALFLMGLAVQAQEWHQVQADSLRGALSKSEVDTTRVNLLLKLAEFEIFKPGEFKTDLDSAASYINQAKIINERVKSADAYGYIDLTESYLDKERGQNNEGKILAEKAIRILSKANDKYQLGQAYACLSEYFSPDNPAELPKRMHAVEHAAKIYKQGGYTERAAYEYRMLGELDTTVDADLQHLNLSLAMYQSIHYKQLQGVYDLFAVVCIYQSDFKKALNYDLNALKVAENVRDTTMQLCSINNHLGVIHYKLGENELAIKYFEAALVTAEAYKDVQTIYFLTTNIADTYQKLGRPHDVVSILQRVLSRFPLSQNVSVYNYVFADCYLRAYTTLKQYNLAMPYSNQLLNVINTGKLAKANLSDIYAALIAYFFASKQYPRELPYLVKNDALSRQLNISANIAMNDKAWFELDTAQHDYKGAVDHLLKFNQRNDSVFTVAKNKEIQELQVRYDTREKDGRIKFLDQKATIEQNNLQKATLLRNVTIGGIILVLIIAGLLYRQSRLRQKANKVITLKNDVITNNNYIITHKNELLQSLVTEKEWLLKEVHHRVKNNLHSVICLLESQAAYLENDALKAIEESQHRIYTMSLIHQKLYQSEDIKTIDMSVYIPELVQYLSDSFDVSGKIHFSLNIGQINLNPAQAIPLALIINEALTNSIKYAFRGNRRGEVTISMTDYCDQFKLELADNGIGMSKEKKESRKDSLGLELMKGLAKEIRGEIVFENNNGVKITIIFGHDVLNDMDALQSDYLVSPQPGDIYL